MTPEEEYRAAHPEKLRMYDVQIDGFRDVTQRDIHLLNRAAQNWGRVKDFVEKLHQEYMSRINEGA